MKTPPFLRLLYHKNAILSILLNKVSGSSPKGRGKGVMVKKECFLPLKHQKPLKFKAICVRCNKIATLRLREAQPH
jgi:hypothetical protein